jgi:hypothetical protein
MQYQEGFPSLWVQRESYSWTEERKILATLNYFCIIKSRPPLLTTPVQLQYFIML